MGRLRTWLGVLIRGREAGFRRRMWNGLRPRGPGPGPASTTAPPTPSGGVLAGGKQAKEAPKGVTPPDGFEVVLHRDALAPGEVTEVILAGTAVAVCNIDGNFHAVSNTCPHAGGPLGEGKIEGASVVCPYHGWAFEVSDGRCSVQDDVRLPVYEVRVVGDAVCVRL